MSRADEIEAAQAFHAHEMGTDAAGQSERAWLRWLAQVERKLSCDLNAGLDRASDLFDERKTPEEAAAILLEERCPDLFCDPPEVEQ